MVKTYLRRCFTILIGLIVSVCHSFGQKYNFENISEKFTLQQNYIYEIAQSQNDEILLATEDGLLKFNGLQFELVQDSILNDESILNCIFSTSKGEILLGYADGTIFSSTIKNGWKKISSALKTKGKVIKFLQSANGNKYVLIENNGLFLISNSKITQINFGNLINSEIIDAEIIDNKLIVATKNEMKLFDVSQSTNDQIFLMLSSKIKKAIVGQEIASFYSNNHNWLFILTSNNKLFCVSLNGNSDIMNEIDLNFIHSKIEDVKMQKNVIWMASKFDGLFKLEFADQNFNSFSIRNFTSGNGMADNHIKSLFIDNRNILWIGYYGKGISRIVDDNNRLYDNFSEEKFGTITAIASDNKSLFFVGSTKGVFKFDPGFNYVFNPIKLPIQSPEMVITSLCFDAKGRLWIGTNRFGVFINDFENKKIIDINREYGVNITNVNSIGVNSNGNVYMATDFGMAYFNSKENKVSVITSNEGLVHNVLNQICVDKKNTLWFAANDATLFKYENQEFQLYKDIANLKSYKLSSVIQSSLGNIVFGTEGDGFFIQKNDKWTQINTANGLVSNYVYNLVEDNNKNIWVIHKKGISIYNQVLKTVEQIKLESIFNSTLTKNAVFGDKAGYIWLGTDKGLLRLFKSSRKLKKGPAISIRKITLNNKVVSNLESYYSYNAYNLRFDFFGVQHLNPEAICYKYILEGFENKWNTGDFTHTYAYYPRLEEGNYTFKLYATFNDGSKSRVINIKFSIGTPLWKSVWFWIILFILFVILISLVFRWRINYLNNLKLKLEKQVRLRTKELHKEKNNLIKAKGEIERKNTDILDSINYAKRLQNAVLPSMNRWEKELPNSFIFYKPKAIVAGDFYWLMSDEDTVFFAAGDCTGHGVPGAMVSVFCADSLSRSVRNRKLKTPATILDQARSFVIEMFEYAEEDIRDGMDISLCKLNTVSLKLEWAGANNPLWIWRKSSQKIEIFEGDKQPVGNSYSQKPFTNHSIQLFEGDCLYLFTDGYADQFGGPDKRKFRVSGLRELLQSIGHKNILEQKNDVYKAFTSWQGEVDQIDDVCVIGVRV